jgi:PTS system fructose-specific IIC component
LARIVVITDCKNSKSHEIMAANAIKKIAENQGHEVKIETTTYRSDFYRVDQEDIEQADIIIMAFESRIDMKRFKGKFIYPTSISNAIIDTQVVLDSAIKIAKIDVRKDSPPPIKEGKVHIAAITACPTGIAHTFMAAEALKKAAEELGYVINIETQGSVGAKNILTPSMIEEADLVVVAADTTVDLSRFKDKPIHFVSTNKAINDPHEVLNSAFEQAQVVKNSDINNMIKEVKRERKLKQPAFYKHLLTGVSFMIPVVVAGGLIIALSFIFGIDAYKEKGSIAEILMNIGGASFKLIVPILSGYIAYSIADRPGLAPGIIGGFIADELGAGFLGGIISGFLAGYIAMFFRDFIRLPKNWEGIKPVLIIPFLSTLIVGLLLYYIIGMPVQHLMKYLTSWLTDMSSTNAIILGLVIGGMMAFDMGGPINKSAYTFAVGLLASNVYMPMAAAMAAGMTPPLGMFLAASISKRKFMPEEIEASKAAGILGLCFITEGAIPFAAKDPFRVIPAIVVGSATTGAISAYFKCGLLTPHGGIFALIIPHAVINLPYYIFAIAIGALITALLTLLTKKSIY